MGKLASEGAKQVMGGGAGNLGMFATNLTGATPALGAANFVPGVAQVGCSVGTIPQIGGAANLGNAIPVDKSIASLAGGYTPPPTIGQNLGNLGTGVKNLTGFGDMSIGDAYKQFTDVGGGSAMDLAMPVGTAVLSGLEPSDLGYGGGNIYDDPEKGKYRGPQGQLNLSDQFDTGLRLATGGTIQSGGIRDLYGTPDNQPTISPGLSGFGLGRLNNLAGEQAMTQAQTLGYAGGGGVVAGEKGMNLDEDTLNLNLVGKPSENGSSTGTQRGYGINLQNPNPFTVVKSGINLQNPNPFTVVKSGINLQNPDPFYASRQGFLSNTPQPTSYALNLNSGQQQAQYAQGGYLNGQGDGMSDSIPATIEGKQPARLADGEFVIPADVVSHIGNGSSKAGSKRLYAMLDKVRHARTGNKKQGKEIKAEKYLPA
jgi:hypothetical protein